MINGAHIHLILNHFPLIGLFFSILIVGIGLYRSNESILRAGLLIAFIAGFLAIPTFLSGEPAEEVIEKMAGFSEHLVEEHEDAALFAVWTMGLTGVLAGLGLFFSLKKGYLPKPLKIAIVAIGLFTMTVVGRTNYLGGQISHPEIRDSKTQP